MNEKLSAHDEMEIIESIIYTFEGYALNDLQYSRLESSAKGILLMQVLDDVSGFLFIGSPRERVGQFVASYLSEYVDLAVYDVLKNSLIFNYVVNTAGTGPSDGDQKLVPAATYEDFPVANSLFPGHKGEVGLYFCAQRDNGYQIFVEVEDRRVVKDTARIPLDLVIVWMGLRKVEEVFGL